MKLRLLICLSLLLLVAACGSAPSEPANTETPDATETRESPPEPAGDTADPGEDPTAETPTSETPKQETPAKPASPPPAPDPPPAPVPDKPVVRAEPDEVDEGPHPGLLDPSKATEKAPETYRVKFETTKGDVIIQVNRSWAPLGADRFYNLVKIGFFDDVALFRVVKQPRPFMVQFGISGKPAVAAAWDKARIRDEAVRESNRRGRMTFAKTGAPNSRTTQVFINFGDNGFLDSQGFSPFGEVEEGMDVVDSFYAGYGERGPNQQTMMRQGNAYARQQFDRLDYIVRATVIK